MGMYDQFRTDAAAERNGVVIDYGDFRVTIARAGGANKRYQRVFESKTKPYRRAMQTQTIDPDLSQRLMRETYAEAVVRGWETLVDGEWRTGIEGPDGALLPFTTEHVIATFEALPDLFADLVEQSMRVALFRQEVLEADAGN